MKKVLLLIVLIFISKNLLSQTKQFLDSLNNVVSSSKVDTAKVNSLCSLSQNEFDPVKKFSLVNKALAIARRIKYETGEARCYQTLGSYFSYISDYPQALDYHLKALKMREMNRISNEYYSSLNSIGSVYSDLQNYEAALAYYFRSAEILKRTNVGLGGLYLFGRMGTVYLRQNKLDSALIYMTRSYEKARKASQKYHLSSALTGLGNVHAAMNNTDLAFSYYRMSIANGIENNSRTWLPQCYLGLAKLFNNSSKKDSATYYAKQALILENERLNRAGVIEAASLLAKLHENSDDKEAVRYYKLAKEAQDSVFNGSNTAQIQSMTFTEQERQKEINESKFIEEEDRKHNLQFAAIAIGLITFIILFFALSRSIIVKTKFIEFFGVLGLLAVFEFINLFIHPYLSHATNDSPVLMLLILIIIGAGLVPLHHKLEKWITNIMVEKNKKIRLEAAEKTIAELTVKQAN